ncbi:hypothetical protein PFFCH_02127 [Plasmodium falciparum FCH/4]|uniref:Uncharacterized protein n=1 Tax=Plasmodium falciparum FCH/4 TaxID=1036724 RepID=A0A024VP26_PLAFA|nr:hypothetical protein PFFCH_02127 [Plasmodium falciparum FCH/4]
MPRQSRVRNADRNILRLREGASPSYLINGYTSSNHTKKIITIITYIIYDMIII